MKKAVLQFMACCMAVGVSAASFGCVAFAEQNSTLAGFDAAAAPADFEVTDSAEGEMDAAAETEGESAAADLSVAEMEEAVPEEIAGVEIEVVSAEETEAVIEAETIIETEPSEAAETIMETEPSEAAETVMETELSEAAETVMETELSEAAETVMETEPSEAAETVMETEFSEAAETVTETELSEESASEEPASETVQAGETVTDAEQFEAFVAEAKQFVEEARAERTGEKAADAIQLTEDESEQSEESESEQTEYAIKNLPLPGETRLENDEPAETESESEEGETGTEPEEGETEAEDPAEITEQAAESGLVEIEGTVVSEAEPAKAETETAEPETEESEAETEAAEAETEAAETETSADSQTKTDEFNTTIAGIQVVEPTLVQTAGTADADTGTIDTSKTGETAFAQCEDYVNVRAEASTEGEIVGKIYNNNAMTILGQYGDWYKVKSGNVTGYVKAEYIATGITAESIAQSSSYTVATVQPEVLMVRSSASEDAEIVGMLYASDAVEVVSYDGDWMQVVLSDGTYGYVSAWYVDYDTYYATGETLEEEQERLDEEWLAYQAEQEAAQAAANEAVQTETAVSSSSSAMTQTDTSNTETAAPVQADAEISAAAALAEAAYQNYLEKQAEADAATQQADEQLVYDTSDAAVEAYEEYLKAVEAYDNAVVSSNAQTAAESTQTAAESTQASAGTETDTETTVSADAAAVEEAYQNYLEKQAEADAATQQADVQLVYDTYDAAVEAYQEYLDAVNGTASVTETAAEKSEETDSPAETTAAAETEAEETADAETAAETTAAAEPAAEEAPAEEAAAEETEAKKSAEEVTVEETEAKKSAEKETNAKSADTSSSSSSAGESIAEFATQFVGNPYVYGGTSLTNGADCSGFTQSVYANFGISIPRTAAAQSQSGTPVSLDELQPGDLLFYSDGTGISHVTMYIGDGQVVHASSSTTGIIISDYNYRTPVSARRYW